MGYIPQYGRPALVPDTFLSPREVWQSKGIVAAKPNNKTANTGWWEPSQSVNLSGGLAFTYAQKKRAPGPAYLNISAPSVNSPTSTGDDC